MDHADIRHHFLKAFNGQPNFITPTFVRYGSRQNAEYLFEITKGTGMTNNTIYGCTVLARQSQGVYVHEHDLCCGGHASETEAIEEMHERIKAFEKGEKF